MPSPNLDREEIEIEHVPEDVSPIPYLASLAPSAHDTPSSAIFVAATSSTSAPTPSIPSLALLDPNPAPSVHGTSSSAIFFDNEAAIYIAARLGRIDMMQRLINKGVDINLVNDVGASLMHVAAEHGHISILEALTQAGVNRNAQDLNGNTPLHYAAMNGQLLAVQYLVLHDVDVSIKNTSGETAQELALKLNKSDIAFCLQRSGTLIRNSTDRALFANIDNGQITSVRRRLTIRPELRDATRGGSDSPALQEGLMHATVRAGHVEMIACLHSLGVSIDKPNSLNQTPLHIAASLGDTAAVSFLIQNGADICKTDNDGQTAQDLAEIAKHHAIAKLLANSGTVAVMPSSSSSSSAASSSSSSVQSIDNIALQRLVDALHAFERELTKIEGTENMQAALASFGQSPAIDTTNALDVLDTLIQCTHERPSFFRSGMSLLSPDSVQKNNKTFHEAMSLLGNHKLVANRNQQIDVFCNVVNDIMQAPKTTPLMSL